MTDESAALVLRVWREPPDRSLRVRVTWMPTNPGAPAEHAVATAGSVEEAVAVVRDFLREFTGEAFSPQSPSTPRPH